MKTEESENKKPCCKICGKNMKYIDFNGYYDQFFFWDFGCDCNDNIKFKVDEIEKGAYA